MNRLIQARPRLLLCRGTEAWNWLDIRTWQATIQPTPGDISITRGPDGRWGTYRIGTRQSSEREQRVHSASEGRRRVDHAARDRGALGDLGVETGDRVGGLGVVSARVYRRVSG